MHSLITICFYLSGETLMKKFINASLITLALTSGICSASQPAEADKLSQPQIPYACKVMLERGSKMFCGDETNSNLYAKAAISELAYISNSSYACNTMISRGSEMFCQKEKAETFSHASNP